MRTTITTRWIDVERRSLSEVENLLLTEHNESTTAGSKYSNWSISKIFDENKKSVFNGKSIEYNVYSYSVDRTPEMTNADEDATVKRNGYIIVYFSNDRIRYIIDKNSDALTLLRKMLFYTGKKEITKNFVSTSGDLFVWLISKIYAGENVFESESEDLGDLTISSITGFKGNTEDLVNKVSASGKSVMNILSSLSFLIESQNLNQVTLNISYQEHNSIELTLSTNGTISSSIDKYLGDLIQKSQAEKYTELFILLYSEIFPIIIQKYQSEIEEDRWGQGRCVKFLEKVANDLSSKIQDRIKDLSERPEQLILEELSD